MIILCSAPPLLLHLGSPLGWALKNKNKWKPKLVAILLYLNAVQCYPSLLPLLPNFSTLFMLFFIIQKRYFLQPTAEWDVSFYPSCHLLPPSLTIHSLGAIGTGPPPSVLHHAEPGHAVIMGSKPIMFMDQACGMILWKDTRSVSAKSGKQWFLPFFPFFPVNFKLLTWC